MKKLTKIIAIIFLLSIILIQTTLAEENTDENTQSFKFSDLTEQHLAYDSIEKLVNAGIINGYPDNTFKPEGFITRAEIVKIVNLIYSYTEKQETTNLTDVNTDDWFFEHVLIAQEAGYIVGYEDNTFRPNDDITREQLCKIIDSINNLIELPFDKTPSDEVSPWAVEYVNRVLSNRIMLLDENNNFRATAKATRAEACDALAKFVIIDNTENSDLPSYNPPGNGKDEEITEQELYDIMDKVIRRLNNGVIPELTSDAQIEIVNDIISNMQKYKADNNHNYEKAADKTYEKYDNMTEEEQEELKELIQLKNTTNDLLKLKKFFFPNVKL